MSKVMRYSGLDLSFRIHASPSIDNGGSLRFPMCDKATYDRIGCCFRAASTASAALHHGGSARIYIIKDPEGSNDRCHFQGITEIIPQVKNGDFGEDSINEIALAGPVGLQGILYSRIWWCNGSTRHLDLSDYIDKNDISSYLRELVEDEINLLGCTIPSIDFIQKAPDWLEVRYYQVPALADFASVVSRAYECVDPAFVTLIAAKLFAKIGENSRSASLSKEELHDTWVNCKERGYMHRGMPKPVLSIWNKLRDFKRAAAARA